MVYCPKGIHITSIPDLSWHLFSKHLTESSKLPPTVDALDEHIERVRIQSRVWCQATMMWQHLFDPLKHGYYQNDHGEILPTTTKVPPPPQAIVELVRYVSVKPIAQPRSVHAGDTTWLARTFVCVGVTVKMMRNVIPKMTRDSDDDL